MIKQFPYFIGFRYIRSRKNRFISFVSLISVLGIALGVMILITVLSVMNGFDKEIHQKVFDFTPHLFLVKKDPELGSLTKEEAHRLGAIGAYAPMIEAQGLLLMSQDLVPINLRGIRPEIEQKVSQLAAQMEEGQLSRLQAGSFQVIISEALAIRYGIAIGDKVTVLIPKARIGPMGLMPIFKWLQVSGTFKADGGFIGSETYMYLHFKDASNLLRSARALDGYVVKLPDPYLAPLIRVRLQATALALRFNIIDWTMQYGAYLKAIKIEKTMMFLILLLLIAIAAFNLVTSLVMLVKEKQADIAILRTMGARSSAIMHIFFIQGWVIGLIGTTLGLLTGLWLAHHVTAVVECLQRVTHMELFVSSVYLVDQLPSQVLWSDVIKICIASLVMSWLATLYPAWRASKIHPADILSYE